MSSNRKPGRSTRKTAARKPPAAKQPEVLPAETPEGSIDEENDESLDREVEDEDVETEIESQLPANRESNRDVKYDLSESEVGAISVSDPLRRYLDEIRRHPLLDPQEEFDLAIRLRDKGDLEAARRLVQANLRLVVKIAFEYRNMYSNVLDLVQEGNVGLMKAVSKYDPTRGARLGYYSSWWIRSYILKYLLDNFRLVRIGTTQAQKKLFYHLMREKERLEAQGMLAGPKLLAEKLNVRERDVVEMEQRLSGRGAEMSIDTPVDRSDERSATHADFLIDDQEPADERLARNQLLQLLEDNLPEFEKGLNDKERRLLHDRMLAEEPKTLQEIADLYGLTRERARQIEAKIIEKLRDFLRDSLG